MLRNCLKVPTVQPNLRAAVPERSDNGGKNSPLASKAANRRAWASCRAAIRTSALTGLATTQLAAGAAAATIHANL